VSTVAPARSWLPIDAGCDFSLANLPFGVVERPDGNPCLAVAIGDYALDLAALRLAGLLPESLALEVFVAHSLECLLACGPRVWRPLRARVQHLLDASNDELSARPDVRDRALLPLETVRPLQPVYPGDYIDFYSSLEHATNMGRVLRPGGEPLAENWRHLPVGYHGRSASVVASGTPVTRPNGQYRAGERVVTGPTQRLDFELEVGFVVGSGNPPGTRIRTSEAAEHIFGYVLVNDWSARDLQAFEYQPLGPFLGKSFATSISPWVVTLDALRPYFVAAPVQQPAVAPYLRCDEPWALDLELEVELRSATGASTRVTRTNFKSMYWTAPQQLAHATVNGAAMHAGDLCASGTVSGTTPGSYGSLMETTGGGPQPLTLPDGSTRTFLEDGDEVVMRGWCGGDDGRARVGFGEVRGTVVPAPELHDE
jgi:fumarylacetoacetase